MFDFICIGYLAFFVLHKYRWRETTRNENISTGFLLFFMLVSFLNTIWSIVF